jgi:coenzyme F420 hydrogenase subunit beta
MPLRSEADHAFGTALEIWEGHASDPEIRYSASSGGILTALALYCLEQEKMNFVLHTGMNEKRPLENNTVKSRTRDELMTRTGSRYAPASPCEGLAAIEESDGPCVFIGKPCDVAAVSMLRSDRPKLDRNLGLVLTFFCAGTPSTQGTRHLAESLKILPDQIDSVRYRGEGWPGRFTIVYDDERQKQSLSYAESWGELTHYRSLRCNLCPDGLGRLGDISCGDAWENSTDNGNPGLSLVVVRTARGQHILRKAIAANYVQLRLVTPDNVFAAQKNLLTRRTEIFGRFVGLKLFGIPLPRFSGFSLVRSWLRLPLGRKVKTILGTAKRVMVRRLYVRRPAFRG